jgi:RHS repeat-associated protein
LTVLNPDFSARGASSYNWNYSFQGKRFDGTVGLYDSRGRVYSPTLMRWLQTDRLGFAAGDTNLYRYVFNSPTNAVDPSGLDSSDNGIDETVIDLVMPKILADLRWDASDDEIIESVADALGVDPQEVANLVVGYLADVFPAPELSEEDTDFIKRSVQSMRDFPAYFGATVGEGGPEAASTTKKMLISTAIFVGSVLLPGPEDAIMAGLASKYGLRAIWRGGKRVWAKLVGKEIKRLTSNEAKFYAREFVSASKAATGRGASNPARGRFDAEHLGRGAYDRALENARRNAGSLGEKTKKMYDPKTGTLIGEKSLDGNRGWRIDGDHVNWWDWTGGIKGRGGRYGHDFFPPGQSGPHSEYKGYAPWETP